MNTRLSYRQQYDDARDEAEREVTDIIIDAPSLTNQSFAEDADLNIVMKRWGITDGALPPAAIDPRYYGDFTNAPDFRQALDAVRDAEDHFNRLPAEIRSRFGNNPVYLHDWVNNPDNWEEAVRLGLLHKTVTQEAEPPAPPTDT